VVDAGECVPCVQVLAGIVCCVWTNALRLELQVGWTSRRAMELAVLGISTGLISCYFLVGRGYSENTSFQEELETSINKAAKRRRSLDTVVANCIGSSNS
jgi:hypothetical protein